MFDFCSSTSSALRAGVDALVVVVDRDRERLLGPLLTDHILVEDVVDLFGLRNVPQPEVLVDVLVELFFDDLVAELDALVADVDAGACDQLAHLLLRLAAEAALQLTFLIPESEHRRRSGTPPRLLCRHRQARLAWKIWSTIP